MNDNKAGMYMTKEELTELLRFAYRSGIVNGIETCQLMMADLLEKVKKEMPETPDGLK